jgi:hypothetical protein
MVLSEPLTALGCGLLWPLFEPGRLRLLFVKAIVTLEQWPEWIKNAYTHRTRQLGEKLGEDESWELICRS